MTIHHVTENSQMGELLTRNHEIIHRLIDNIPVMLVIWDPKLQRFTLNRHAESVLGWTTADANDPDIMRRVFPDPVYRSEITDFMLSLSPEWREQNMIAKDGSRIPTTWTNLRLSDDTMIGVGLDLRERNRVLSALRESEERLRVTLLSAADEIWITDAQQRIVSISDSAMDNLGVDTDKWTDVESALDQLEILHPDGSPRSREDNILPRALRGELIKNQEEMIRNLATGQLHWREVSGAPVRDSEGTIIGAVAVARDITERKQAEEDLWQLNETLEQRVAERTVEAEQRAEALRQLALELSGAEDLERRRIATILHDDLQQYLAAIRFRLSSLIPKELSTSKTTEQISPVESLIDESIQKCRNLSHELSPPVLHQNGLIPALEWLCQDMKEKYGLRVNLRAEPGAEPASLEVATVLFRSIRELLFNIIKHANTDSADIQAYSDDSLFRIKVGDPGRGFNAGQIRSQKAGKGGFGLLNVAERIHFLGGTFHVKSAPGQGARIDISVPNRPSRSEKSVERISDIAEKQKVETGQPAPEHQGKIRILLTDDHAVMRDGLTGILQHQPDLEVVAQAENGLEAVQMADQNAPDVILMDITMPEMDGIAATEKILKKHPGVRIIGLTMHDDPSIEEKMRRAGACDYIFKASPSDVLVQTIRMSMKQ